MGTVLITSEKPEAEKSLSVYRERGGYNAWKKAVTTLSCEEIIEMVKSSGLSGKGGAGFPTYKKMELIHAQSDTIRYLVINGSEHEPGSIKDKYLLENYPHKVLEGALIMAYTIRAEEIVVAINRHAVSSIECFEQSITDLNHSGFDFFGITVKVIQVPDQYIVGEESALLEVIEGREPLPRRKPPFPIESGLMGHPTLILNVETVAHLPYIVNHGPEVYANLGMNSQGVTLCTLGEEYQYPGVYEVPLGTSIRTIIAEWGGGLKDGVEVKAIQPGGPSSGFLQKSDLDLPLDAKVLREHRSALGCAVIRAYSEKDCMVREICEIMSFFAHGSCGQCPECRMETNMLQTIMRQVCNGQGNWKLIEQIDNILSMVQGKGICGLIKMPGDPIQTGVKLFHEEFQRHIDEKKCEICFGS